MRRRAASSRTDLVKEEARTAAHEAATRIWQDSRRLASSTSTSSTSRMNGEKSSTSSYPEKSHVLNNNSQEPYNMHPNNHDKKPSTSSHRPVYGTDAWMCGVCGKAFSSYQVADQHETLHIQQVVRRLKDGSVQSLVDAYPAPQLLLPHSFTNYMFLADQALLDVCRRAETQLLTKQQRRAERHLAWLAADQNYYRDIDQRARERQSHPASRYRTDKQNFVGKLQNKLLDAYQIMKEQHGTQGLDDQYVRRNKDTTTNKGITHTAKTLYVNVMVKNSIQVVKNELERLAKQRWETNQNVNQIPTNFERFRVYAHANIVRLAGLALASDFTPRRIAVQLSNDLYRLLTPRLKRRGVTIETEIEYRVGPYFVIATNIKFIDWTRLIKATHREVVQRRARWERQRELEGNLTEESQEKGISLWTKQFKDNVKRIYNLNKYDVLAQALAWLFHLHWTISIPICWLAYYTVLGTEIRQFIISSVTDEVFFYVEQKGMEMEIQVRSASTQAAFMLSALRELRADGRELKKKQKETESQEKGNILGPLLGPAIKADQQTAVQPPSFVLPENLEYVGLELDLPVGFRRLRWALLSSKSKFVTDAVYKTEARYDDVNMGKWNRFDEYIGEPNLPADVNPEDFVGAEKEGNYIMPRSAFVKANRCTETHYITAYNDYCFCLRKKALTPEVPYGTTFVAWTQYMVVNTGHDTCRLYCSVEPEFPNGPPFVHRQIKSGMRAGVGELFVLVGETITKYADEYP